MPFRLPWHPRRSLGKLTISSFSLSPRRKWNSIPLSLLFCPHGGRSCVGHLTKEGTALTSSGRQLMSRIRPPSRTVPAPPPFTNGGTKAYQTPSPVWWTRKTDAAGRKRKRPRERTGTEELKMSKLPSFTEQVTEPDLEAISFAMRS